MRAEAIVPLLCVALVASACERLEQEMRARSEGLLVSETEANAPPPAPVVAAAGERCGAVDGAFIDCSPDHGCMRLSGDGERCHRWVKLGERCRRDAIHSTCGEGNCVPVSDDTGSGVCRVTKLEGEACTGPYECGTHLRCIEGVCTKSSSPASGDGPGWTLPHPF